MIDWSLVKSNYASVITCFAWKDCLLQSQIKTISYLNSMLLNYSQTLEHIRVDLNNRFPQMPNHWDPHLKLEYAKMNLRSVVTETDET